MNQAHSLTFNGVLYLSLGFRQEYCLQVLTFRRGEQGELQLVLYDGNTYIGALYHQQCQNSTERSRNAAHMQQDQSSSREVAANNESQLQEYDVVRIFPLTVTQNQPILIESLQVVQTGINCLLGREVITLEEFMRRRNFSRRPTKVEEEREERIEMGRKMMKGEDENQLPSNLTQPTEADRTKSFVIDQNSQQRREQARNEDLPTQKMTAQVHESIIFEESTLLENQQPRSQQQQSKSKEQADVQRFLSLVSSRSISEEGTFTLNKKTIEIDLQGMPETAAKGKEEKASMYIRDLYERMHRFRIICRVNHLSHFTSQRGTSCIKLMLIDQTGDEIICMLYEKFQERTTKKPTFVKGRSYVFENGEVKSDEGGLSLTVQWSGVTEIQRFMPSFVPGKMHRLGQIAKQASFFIQKAINLDNDSPQSKKPKEINICGIFKGFKEEPKLAKTLFRVNGFLCDPDQQLCIQFSLLVEELASFPEQGAAVSLHNVHSIEDDRTLRLQSTKKSYILNEAGNTHEYFADLLKSSATKSWKLHEYRNLSDVTFVPRTISQLKVILGRMMEHDTAYSEIDCSIASLTERKFYNSCSVCRRETRENGGMFVYCLSCKRNVKTVKRVQFDLEVQDSSGSLIACLFSDEMQGFVNILPQEYTKQSKEDRQCFTDLCAYTQIIMRVKSSRHVGGADHKAVSATRFNHKRGLSQIKSMVIEEKTKYTPW